jgi:GT2 family glycosyltransferase
VRWPAETVKSGAVLPTIAGSELRQPPESSISAANSAIVKSRAIRFFVFTSLIINRKPLIMDTTPAVESAPRVSIIIPARNEEANLERCLRSLVVQRGVDFEIIIVNDSSTDRTRSIAESFSRVRQCPFIGTNNNLGEVYVIDAPEPLPAGWSGKNFAMVAGEKAARGEWLLFTDADTEHLEGSLAAAVAEAEQSGAALLSYSPVQLLTGIRQQLVMPVLFGELAARYSPRKVSDPARPDAAANGQYMLVRAKVHRKLGGFTAVAPELLEDVALARLYKQNGQRILFRLGRGMVQTRMYSRWEDLVAGFTKNLALLFPDARELAAKRSREFLKLMLVPLFALWCTVVVAHGGGAPTIAAVGILWLYVLSNLLLFYVRISRAHFAPLTSLLAIFGLPLFAGLLRGSAAAYQKGSVNWRGRSYPAAGVESSAGASNSK